MSEFIADPVDGINAIHAPSGFMAGTVYLGPVSDRPISAEGLTALDPVGWTAPLGWDEATQ